MNKVFSIALLAFGISASAQVSIAPKANILIPTSEATWQNFKDATGNAISQKGENITGYNAGLSFKIDLPTALYVMPEIYYTNFKNEVTVTDTNNQQTTLEAKTNRIDIPVLLGYNLLGQTLSAYVGPVASFQLDKGDNFNNFVQDVKAKDFTLGYQFGLQSELKKLILTARYEGAFSEDQRSFVNTVAGSNQEIKYDNRPSFFMLGLGYKF